MSRGGWALCSFVGSFDLNTTTGMQNLPIRRMDGTTDMQEYWNPSVRGIAPTIPGYYRVSWAFRVSTTSTGSRQFSVGILPRLTEGLYGSTAIVNDGTSYMHTGVTVVRVQDSSTAGVISAQMDGYGALITVSAGQMLAEFIDGV